MRSVPSVLDLDVLAKTYVEQSERLTWPFGRDGLLLAGFPGKVEPTTPLKLLDVACGPGHLALEAANMGFDVTATDWSSGMIERVQQRAEAASLRVATLSTDGQTLEGLPDSTFDVVTSTFGLFHFADREAGWRSVLRVLKPGGRVMGAVWIPSGVSFPSMGSYIIGNAEDYVDRNGDVIAHDGGLDNDYSHHHVHDHDHRHQHDEGNSEHRGCSHFSEAADYEHELAKCGFVDPVIHTVRHDICFSSGKEVVEMQIGAALTTNQMMGKDSRSLMLCLTHYLDLVRRGIDPFEARRAASTQGCGWHCRRRDKDLEPACRLSHQRIRRCRIQTGVK